MFCTLLFVLVSKWNGIKMTKRNLNGEIPSGELDVSSYLMETSLVSLNQPSYQILSLYKRNGSIIGMIWLATLSTGFMDHGSKDQHFVQPSTHSSRTCHPQEVITVKVLAELLSCLKYPILVPSISASQCQKDQVTILQRETHRRQVTVSAPSRSLTVNGSGNDCHSLSPAHNHQSSCQAAGHLGVLSSPEYFWWEGRIRGLEARAKVITSLQICPGCKVANSH